MAAASRKVFELFVAKVPWTAASNEMRQHFGQFGEVKRCLVPFDKETGFHKGFCWIGYATEEEMNNALQTSPHVFEGTKLMVRKNRHQLTAQKIIGDSDQDPQAL